MKSRTGMPARERQARSRLARLAHAAEFLRGNLTLMRHTCGKAGCRCARGEKHASWYLAYSEGGRKRMVSVSRAWLAQVRDGVAHHRETKGLLESLAQAGLRRWRAGKRESPR